MTIACSLRWGVAFVGSFSTGRGLAYTGNYFKRGIDIGERRSFETAIVKKADMWLLITFL